MKTHDWIPKAVFFAEMLFQRLRGHMVFKDENMIISVDEKSYQILLFNHIDFQYRIRKKKNSGNAYSYTADTEMIKEDSDDLLVPELKAFYDPLENRSLKIQLIITGIENGLYETREYIVNRKYGSSFDHWILMGASEPDPEEISYLKNVAYPLQRKQNRTVSAEKTVIETVLEPGEVHLFEFTKKK